MKIGDLVKTKEGYVNDHSDCEGFGIIIKKHPSDSKEWKYTMFTVEWLNGMGTGLYWYDELEALCSPSEI